MGNNRRRSDKRYSAIAPKSQLPTGRREKSAIPTIRKDLTIHKDLTLYALISPLVTLHIERKQQADCYVITINNPNQALGEDKIVIVTHLQPLMFPNVPGNVQIYPPQTAGSTLGGTQPNVKIEQGNWLYIFGWGISVGTSSVAAIADSSKLVVDATVPDGGNYPRTIHNWHHFDDARASVWQTVANSRATALSSGFQRRIDSFGFIEPPDAVGATDAILGEIRDCCKALISMGIAIDPP